MRRTRHFPDSRILITGGEGADGPSASVELYDPSADSFSAGAPMLVARSHHTSVLLPDGRAAAAVCLRN
jgi:hypothetical protein